MNLCAECGREMPGLHRVTCRLKPRDDWNPVPDYAEGYPGYGYVENGEEMGAWFDERARARARAEEERQDRLRWLEDKQETARRWRVADTARLEAENQALRAALAAGAAFAPAKPLLVTPEQFAALRAATEPKRAPKTGQRAPTLGEGEEV